MSQYFAPESSFFVPEDLDQDDCDPNLCAECDYQTLHGTCILKLDKWRV